jgi:hypothetical protein
MHLAKQQPIRNKIDLADPSQIRCLKRRLHISADELQRAAGKVGNSIAAVSKELQQVTPVTDAVPAQIEPPPRSEVLETLV